MHRVRSLHIVGLGLHLIAILKTPQLHPWCFTSCVARKGAAVSLFKPPPRQTTHGELCRRLLHIFFFFLKQHQSAYNVADSELYLLYRTYSRIVAQSRETSAVDPNLDSVDFFCSLETAVVDYICRLPLVARQSPKLLYIQRLVDRFCAFFGVLPLLLLLLSLLSSH